MNKELIQKLFSKSCWDEQAEIDIEDFISVEKFAELIVKECVAICQDTDGEDNIDARSGRQDCAVEIQEHFEVEE